MRHFGPVTCLLALASCTSEQPDLFVREEQSVAVDFTLLTGTSRTDLWSVAKVSISGVPTDAVVHSRAAGRWDALSLPELALGQGGFVQDIAVSGKNEVWISSRDLAGFHLWRVSGNGSLEDHTGEVPGEVETNSSQTLQLTDAGGTLLMGVIGTPSGHLYRRVEDHFESVVGLDPSVQFDVLAARGPDDLYVVENSAVSRKLVHVFNGAVSEVPWEDVRGGLPTIAISPAGEVWFWKADGDQTETLTGKHGDGITFTAWSTQGWPVVTADQKVSHRAMGLLAAVRGRLSMFTVRLDAGATNETERASVGVNHIDAGGNVTVGPRLLQCLSLDECSVGEGAFVVLPDGTVIVRGGGDSGKLWFTGSSSSFE